MRTTTVLSLLAFCVALLILPQSLRGQDITGRWTGSAEWTDGLGEHHTSNLSLEIKKDGDVFTANSPRRDGTPGPELKINADGPKVHLYRFLPLDEGEHLRWKLELQDGKLVGTFSALHDLPSKWIYDRELKVAMVRAE